MPNIEEKIWDYITDNTKEKFVYENFRESFPINPDNFIFKIIVGYASGENADLIAAELSNEMAMIGFKMRQADLLLFVQDKEKLFQNEISAAKLASDMLSNGTNPATVLQFVTKILE